MVIRFFTKNIKKFIILTNHSYCGMPLDDDPGTIYGNLQSYKYYIRPTAHQNFESDKAKSSAHFENVHKLLEILAKNGICTTWDMAKIRFSNDIDLIRTKEKYYRRLIVGRHSRNKRLPGILEIGLIVKDGKSHKRAPADQYRLSLHGILYCLDVLNLSNKEIDTIATQYSDVLPKIFGNWDYLKSKLGDEVYKIKILSKGLLFDNLQFESKSNIPIQEIMYYIQKKYQNNYDAIHEKDLADQISYWFFTVLLINYPNKSKNNKNFTETQKINLVLNDNENLKKWYFKFIKEVKTFYLKKNSLVKNFAL